MPLCSNFLVGFLLWKLAMVKKTMDQHVLPNLASIVVIFISFDLWMSHDMDIFSLVIKFLNDTQVPMHITMGLFKVNETTKYSISYTTLVLVKERFGLLHQIITFVKNEGTNLIDMATTLHSMINCECIKILKVYEGTHLGHVTSKACQYATNDDKVFTWLRNVSVKEVHIGLQKTITQTKKFGKGRQECEWACFESKI